MKLKLLINISQALLMARWKQTLVAAIGVTFSITMFVTLLSFMAGLNDLLENSLRKSFIVVLHVRFHLTYATSPQVTICQSPRQGKGGFGPRISTPPESHPGL